jgi:hypothetical protein
MTVTIGAMTPNGTPADADFEFRDTLESPRYLWLRWEGESCIPSPPPAIGQSVVYPASDFVKMLFDNVIGSLFRRDT